VVSCPSLERLFVERVVTGGDREDLCGLNGLHGDGAELSFGCSVTEYEVGDEFREFSLLLLWSYL
jgi:hypothetical protein